jgi:hypothetical protein
MKKHCTTGKTDSQVLRDLTVIPFADWRKRRRKKGLDFIAILPPPPKTNAEYSRCIAKWMATYNQAKAMNARQDQIAMLQKSVTMVQAWPPSGYKDSYLAYLTKELATLQAQQTKEMGVLTALVAAYKECMWGTIT